MTTTLTKRDAVSAALALADNLAEGRVPVADLEGQAIAECRALFGQVVGEGSPTWDVQVAVARDVIGMGGIDVEELAEWVAVFRRRAGDPPEAEATGSGQLSADSGDADDDDENLTVPDELYDQVKALVDQWHRDHPDGEDDD